jgi:tetratricopeptide (TPR) repeat protein
MRTTPQKLKANGRMKRGWRLSRSRLATMNSLAQAYQDAGKLEPALALFEEMLQLARAKLGSDHLYTIMFMGNVACAYQQAGKWDRALPLHEEALRLAKAKLGPDHRYTRRSLTNLVQFYDAWDKPNEAARWKRELESRQTRGAETASPAALVKEAGK